MQPIALPLSSLFKLFSLLTFLTNWSQSTQVLATLLHSSDYLSSVFYLPQKRPLENHHEITSVNKSQEIWKLFLKLFQYVIYAKPMCPLSLLLYFTWSTRVKRCQKERKIVTYLLGCPTKLWCLPKYPRYMSNVNHSPSRLKESVILLCILEDEMCHRFFLNLQACHIIFKRWHAHSNKWCRTCF